MHLKAGERQGVLIATAAASAVGFLACAVALLFAVRRRRQLAASSSSSRQLSSSSSSSSSMHVWAMKTLCDAVLCLDHLWLSLLALAHPGHRLARADSGPPPPPPPSPDPALPSNATGGAPLLPGADAMCYTQGVVLEFVVHASSVWLLLLSVELWRSSRDPFARSRARLPLFHLCAWGFGLLACVGLLVGHVGGSQPNSPCWLDGGSDEGNSAKYLRGPRLVFQLFPLTQLLAVAVSLVVLLRVALLLGRNTAQVTPYRRRVLTRGLLYVGAYGALGIFKLSACLVMLGLHSDGTQAPAQEAFAYSESALLLALALVDAALARPFVAPARASGALLRWLPQHKVAAGSGGSPADAEGQRAPAEDEADSRAEMARTGGSLQERRELTHGEAMEELLSLRALRRDVMLCLLFGIISTLNRRGGRLPFGASPRRRPRRYASETDGGETDEDAESRALLSDSRLQSRYVYDSGTGAGAYDLESFAAAPPEVPVGRQPRRPVQQTRQRVMLPPIYNRELDFIDYERDAFVRLRHVHGISTEDYAHSLWGDQMDQRVKQMTEHFSSGRSGSFFYLTHDRRFLVKTMDRRERDVRVMAGGI